MKNLFKKVTSLALFLVFFLSFLQLPLKAHAAGAQFAVSLNYSFSFEENGLANASQTVTSTNLTDGYYASEYSITVHGKNVTNVSATDGLGSIQVTTKVANEATIITAKLNQQVVGINKSVTFTINYSTDSFAIKRGKIWDVSIPQIETSANVKGYQVTLSVPDSFGNAGKITPTPATATQSGGRKTYTFTKNSLDKARIGVSFGDFQQFKFTLKYRYKNDKVYAVRATIALPPDTEYQALYYKTLEPRPVSMRTDFDGNYLADYIIKPGNDLEVVTTGNVKIADSVDTLQHPQTWSNADLEKFTKADTYLEVDNQQIQKKAKELKNIEEIYNYVVSTVKYDYSRLDSNKLSRRGALATLNKPETSICVDFSDLFVALARAKGIPARGLVGFGYSDDSNLRPTKVEGLVNSTVLHAWPEYYDYTLKKWVQVDPTWGSTTGGIDYFHKLDTNHFVFAINGLSSTLPIPAGGYKTSATQNDDVSVKFSDDKLDATVLPDISLSGDWLTGDNIISGFPATSKLTVKNTSGRAFFGVTLDISPGKNIHLIKPNNLNLGILLPFATQTADIKLRSDSLFDDRSENLVVKLKGTNENGPVVKEITKKITIKPFFGFQTPQVILLLLLLIAASAYAHQFTAQRKLKKNTLQ